MVFMFSPHIPAAHTMTWRVPFASNPYWLSSRNLDIEIPSILNAMSFMENCTKFNLFSHFRGQDDWTSVLSTLQLWGSRSQGTRNSTEKGLKGSERWKIWKAWSCNRAAALLNDWLTDWQAHRLLVSKQSWDKYGPKP